MFGRRKLKLEQPIDADLEAARRLLLDNPKILRRKVSAVAAAHTSKYAEALYTLAAGRRFNWSPEDWAAVLNRLDDSDLTVAQFLETRDNGEGD